METLEQIRPSERLRVYDLVGEAGIDVSDWANYKRSKSPSTNPNYCYDWAFTGNDKVALCLWFDEMETLEGIVCQNLDYRRISASPRLWNPTQRKRALKADLAIQLAWRRSFPVRVIVVDGSRRGDADDRTRSMVERRLLDPRPWRVAAYDDDGPCCLERC